MSKNYTCAQIYEHPFKGGAIQEMGNLCRLLQSNQILLQRHRAQLHTMLGLYAMSMNCMEAAENQLNAALRVSEQDFDTFLFVRGGLGRGPAHFGPAWTGFLTTHQGPVDHFGPNLAHDNGPARLGPKM